MSSLSENVVFKFILSLLTGAAEFAMTISGIVGIFKSSNPFDWSKFVLSFYTICFGIFALLGEFFDFRKLLKNYGFIRHHSGRGLFAMFLGSLGIALGKQYNYLLACGIICSVVGFLQLILGLTILSNDLKTDAPNSQFYNLTQEKEKEKEKKENKNTLDNQYMTPATSSTSSESNSKSSTSENENNNETL
ncbi:golgi apparatus membrane protein tvp15 [Anaeramoeba flamelloides]|uniref:Golgi apparatus membrane protein tvp15 n=1 Tax=Anaeramoeba flamelloides TaxID=1746091 RepID=A0AAV7YAE1_9EUKA|nr:golgi apparatus membrane protein tvp15 [Anaeramoeba flamelloides]